MLKWRLLTSGLLAVLFAVFPVNPAFSEDNEDLAKQAQNPVASMISLPLQNNTSFGIGPHDRTQNVLNIQPVWPISISEGLNLVTRTIVPIIYQPIGGCDSESGLGDVNFTAFFSPADPGKLIWGVGPVLVFPTASDDVLGAKKWGAGPSLVMLTMPGNWVIGVLVNNVWSFAGDSDRADVNFMLIQYFVNYNFSGGWYFSSAPIMTANWKAEEGQEWLVPVGGGAGRIFKVGSQAMNAGFQAFTNIVKPDYGPDWSMRIQLQFLFPR